MKRCISVVLIILLIFSPTISASAAEPTPFFRTYSYNDNFRDVAEDAWYFEPVASAYEYGFVDGYKDGSFLPGQDITVAELLTMSARINAIYFGMREPDIFLPKNGELWYVPYIAYLQERGLLPDGLKDYAVPATRAQMAAIFADLLPKTWYDDRNAELIDKAYKAGLIADVTEDTPYQEQILWMYRQGLLVGMDNAGSFYPMQPVTRAEIATLVTRIVDPAQRMTPNWNTAFRSAAGTTLASLVSAPEKLTQSPKSGDAAAIDAYVRQMLAEDTNKITLTYKSMSKSEAGALAQAFVNSAKKYCEQMYNQANVSYTSSGKVTITFGSTVCNDGDLLRYRKAAMDKAIAVHDALWADGSITADMTEYEIARVYYSWLCENCEYDKGTVSAASISHLTYGALVNGRAVCDGYTGAYNMLLKLEGIECRGLFNSEHIWTVAKLGGTEYHIDTTWGDQNGYIAWSYFGMSEEVSREEHAW